MMRNVEGRGRILDCKMNVLQRGEEIDELISEEFLERRSYESTPF